MLDKIKLMVAYPNYHKIDFSYQDVYGRIMVDCTIHNNRLNFVPVSQCGYTEEEALERALALLAKIEAQQIKIGAPQESDQKNYNGYYRKMINDEVEVEFQNKKITKYNGFVVTGIRKKLNGYYFKDKPSPITDDLSDTGKTETVNNIIYDIYEWDNIGYLSGSSGKALVKDGFVHATKTEFIS